MGGFEGDLLMVTQRVIYPWGGHPPGGGTGDQVQPPSHYHVPKKKPFTALPAEFYCRAATPLQPLRIVLSFPSKNDQSSSLERAHLHTPRESQSL